MDLHLRTDTHFGGDCNCSDDQKNNQKESDKQKRPGCWLESDGMFLFVREKVRFVCPYTRTFFGALLAFPAMGTTFFRGRIGAPLQADWQIRPTAAGEGVQPILFVSDAFD